MTTVERRTDDDVIEVEQPYHQEAAMVEESYYEPYATSRFRRGMSFFKVEQMAWLILGALEVLIAMRFFLKLIAANPNSGFASFVYAITAPFLAPFNSLTPTPAANGAVLEFPALIAMVVYALLFWFVMRFIYLLWQR